MGGYFQRWVFKGAVGLVLLALAACDAVDTLANTAIPLRNPTAPVASQVDVSLARMTGGWVVVSGAGLAKGTRLTIRDNLILSDGVEQPFTQAGPGRFMLGNEEIWVHWLDINNRTAALGSPNGTRVWIMDRTGRPGDRLTAAQKILDWYGYDLGRMD